MKLKLVFILLLAISTSGLAQKIETDHAYFFNTDGSFSWEFYYSLSNDLLIYEHESDDNYKASIDCSIAITQGVDTISSDHWSITDIRSVKDSTIRDLIGQKNYKLQEGQYNVYFSYLTQKGKQKNKKIELNLKYNQSNVELGEIQLARLINKSETNTPFDKYGFYILPNPEAVYATNQMDITLCHSYIVVQDKDDHEDYSLRYRILDAAKMPVRKEMQSISISKESNIYFNYFTTSLSGFPSGVYYIVVDIYRGMYLHESKEKNSIFITMKFHLKLH